MAFPQKRESQGGVVALHLLRTVEYLKQEVTRREICFSGSTTFSKLKLTIYRYNSVHLLQIIGFRQKSPVSKSFQLRKCKFSQIEPINTRLLLLRKSSLPPSVALQRQDFTCSDPVLVVLAYSNCAFFFHMHFLQRSQRPSLLVMKGTNNLFGPVYGFCFFLGFFEASLNTLFHGPQNRDISQSK